MAGSFESLLTPERREALEKLELRSDGMEFASEMIIEACRKGLRIREVPIHYYRRSNPDSKLRSFQDGWRHMKFILLNTPNYLFIYPGSLIFMIGVVLMISAYLRIFIGYFPGIHSMVAGSLLTTTGYQIILFGLFAKIRSGSSLPKILTLENTASAGAIMILSGLVYALILVIQWVVSGFKHLPDLEHDLIAFTLIALGLETYFSAFMLSIIAEK